MVSPKGRGRGGDGEGGQEMPCISDVRAPQLLFLQGQSQQCVAGSQTP